MKKLIIIAFLCASTVFAQENSPQWLIDLRAEINANPLVIDKYEIIVPKPTVEIADPVIVGTETVTDGDITFEADILELPAIERVFGYWEEEIEEQYFEGYWRTFKMGDKLWDSWHPAHKIVLHKMSWVTLAVMYQGNTSSKVFHKPTCRYFDCATCTDAFFTKEEAELAGYRPCGICKP